MRRDRSSSTGDGERCQFARQRAQEQGDQRRDRDKAPWPSGSGRASAAMRPALPSRRSGCGERVAPGPGDREIDGKRARQMSAAGRRDIVPEVEPARLADQDVLRIADERRRRAGIGGAGERHEIGPASRPCAMSPTQTSGVSAKATTSLVRIAERRPVTAISTASRMRGILRGVRDAVGDPTIEARALELRREDHQREEQRDGRHVDGAPRLVERQIAARRAAR